MLVRCVNPLRNTQGFGNNLFVAKTKKSKNKKMAAGNRRLNQLRAIAARRCRQRRNAKRAVPKLSVAVRLANRRSRQAKAAVKAALKAARKPILRVRPARPVKRVRPARPILAPVVTDFLHSVVLKRAVRVQAARPVRTYLDFLVQAQAKLEAARSYRTALGIPAKFPTDIYCMSTQETPPMHYVHSLWKEYRAQGITVLKDLMTAIEKETCFPFGEILRIVKYGLSNGLLEPVADGICSPGELKTIGIALAQGLTCKEAITEYGLDITENRWSLVVSFLEQNQPEEPVLSNWSQKKRLAELWKQSQSVDIVTTRSGLSKEVVVEILNLKDVVTPTVAATAPKDQLAEMKALFAKEQAAKHELLGDRRHANALYTVQDSPNLENVPEALLVALGAVPIFEWRLLNPGAALGHVALVACGSVAGKYNRNLPIGLNYDRCSDNEHDVAERILNFMGDIGINVNGNLGKVNEVREVEASSVVFTAAQHYCDLQTALYSHSSNFTQVEYSSFKVRCSAHPYQVILNTGIDHASTTQTPSHKESMVRNSLRNAILQGTNKTFQSSVVPTEWHYNLKCHTPMAAVENSPGLPDENGNPGKRHAYLVLAEIDKYTHNSRGKNDGQNRCFASAVKVYLLPDMNVLSTFVGSKQSWPDVYACNSIFRVDAEVMLGLREPYEDTKPQTWVPPMVKKTMTDPTPVVVEPITESVIEPIAKPITESVIEPIAKPVTESVTESVTEPVVTLNATQAQNELAAYYAAIDNIYYSIPRSKNPPVVDADYLEDVALGATADEHRGQVVHRAIREFVLAHCGSISQFFDYPWQTSDIVDAIRILKATELKNTTSVVDYWETNGVVTICLGNSTATYTIEGDIAYDSNRCMFNNTVDCVIGEQKRDGKIKSVVTSVNAVPSLSNFFGAFVFLYLPLIDVVWNSATSFDTVGENFAKLLSRAYAIFPTSEDNVRSQNGNYRYMNEVAHSTREFPAGLMWLAGNIRTSNVAVTENNENIWQAAAKEYKLPCKPLDLQKAFGKAAVVLADYFCFNKVATITGDLQLDAIERAMGSLNMDSFFTKGTLLKGHVGHLNLDLFAKHAPNLYRRLEACYGDAISVGKVLTWTIKASKGIKRISLANAKGCPVENPALQGWQLTTQTEPGSGSLIKGIGAFPCLKSPPGAEYQIEEPLIKALVEQNITNFKRTDYWKEGCPVVFCEDLSVEGGLPKVESRTDEFGWTHFTYAEPVRVTTDQLMFCIKSASGNDYLPLAYEGNFNIMLKSFRYKADASMAIDIKQLHIKANCWSEEIWDKGRSFSKGMPIPAPKEFVGLNDSDLHFHRIYTQDSMKMDTVYSWPMLIANTVCHNSKHPAMAAMVAEVERINKLICNDNTSDKLWLEPVHIISGEYNNLIDMFVAQFGRACWFDFKDAPVMSRMIFDLYTGQELLAWANGKLEPVDGVLLNEPVGKADVTQDELLETKEPDRVQPKNVLHIVDNLDWDQSIKDAVADREWVCLADGDVTDEHSNVFVFIMEHNIAVSFYQRTYGFVGTHDLPVCNVSIFESTSVGQSIGNSTKMASVDRGMGYTSIDTVNLLADQLLSLEEGKDAIRRMKLLCLMANGDNLGSENTIFIDQSPFAENGTMATLNNADADRLRAALSQAGIALESDFNTYTTEFEKWCQALQEYTFAWIGEYDSPDYDETPEYNDISNAKCYTISLPALWKFSHLTSTNEDQTNITRKFFDGVLKPLLKKEPVLWLNMTNLVGQIKALLRSRNGRKLICGGGVTGAKRVGNPGLPVGIAAVLYSEDPNSVYQQCLRDGIPVGDALVGKPVLIYNARPPMASGYVSYLVVVQEASVKVIKDNRATTKTEQFYMHRGQKCKLTWHVTDKQIAVDIIAIYIDGGDFDGDNHYIAWLQQTPESEVITYTHALKLRAAAMGMSQYDPRCESYIADHYGIKTWSKATTTLLYYRPTAANPFAKSAIVKKNDYIQFNVEAYDIQHHAVGAFFKLYMIGEHLLDISKAMIASGRGALLSPTLLKLAANDCMLVLVLAEIYEVTLGGHDKHVAELWKSIVKDFIRQGGKFNALSMTARSKYLALLQSMKVNTRGYGTALADILDLLGEICFLESQGRFPHVDQSEAGKANAFILESALVAFELARGKFYGFEPNSPLDDTNNEWKGLTRPGHNLALRDINTQRKDNSALVTALSEHSLIIRGLCNVFEELEMEMLTPEISDMSVSTHKWLLEKWQTATTPHIIWDVTDTAIVVAEPEIAVPKVALDAAPGIDVTEYDAEQFIPKDNELEAYFDFEVTLDDLIAADAASTTDTELEWLESDDTEPLSGLGEWDANCDCDEFADSECDDSMAYSNYVDQDDSSTEIENLLSLEIVMGHSTTPTKPAMPEEVRMHLDSMQAQIDALQAQMQQLRDKYQ